MCIINQFFDILSKYSSQLRSIHTICLFRMDLLRRFYMTSYSVIFQRHIQKHSQTKLQLPLEGIAQRILLLSLLNRQVILIVFPTFPFPLQPHCQTRKYRIKYYLGLTQPNTPMYNLDLITCAFCVCVCYFCYNIFFLNKTKLMNMQIYFGI